MGHFARECHSARQGTFLLKKNKEAGVDTGEVLRDQKIREEGIITTRSIRRDTEAIAAIGEGVVRQGTRRAGSVMIIEGTVLVTETRGGRRNTRGTILRVLELMETGYLKIKINED